VEYPEGGQTAEEALHDNFSNATKALFGTLGFLLLMFGGEVMLDKAEPRYPLGIVLCACGAISFYLAWAGKAIRGRFSNENIQKINEIAGNPAWWLGIVLVFVLSMAAWRMSSVVLSLNAPITASDIADAVVKKLPDAQKDISAARPSSDPLMALQSQIKDKIGGLMKSNKDQLSIILYKLSAALCIGIVA
jgi:hypothetical protein